MNENLIIRKEAAKQMGISECTLSRCVKLGTLVHHRGSTGHRYLVDVPAFIHWMESRNGKKTRDQKEKKVFDLTVEQMAVRRMVLMRSLSTTTPTKPLSATMTPVSSMAS